MTERSQPARTSIARIWMEEPDLLWGEVLPGGPVGLEDAKEHIAACWKLTGRRPVSIVMDVRCGRPVERAARQYLSSPEVAETTVALALLVESSFSRMVASFFLGLGKPPYPAKAFSSEAQARAWVAKLRRDDADAAP
jgi:hypothetical protein